MKKVKLKRIKILSFAAWQSIVCLFSGLFLGTAYCGIGFLFFGGDAINDYMFWYLLVMPAIYFVVTLFASIIAVTLYNLIAGSFGAITFEVETSDNNDLFEINKE